LGFAAHGALLKYLNAPAQSGARAKTLPDMSSKITAPSLPHDSLSFSQPFPSTSFHSSDAMLPAVLVIADVKEPQAFQTDLAILTREACYEAILPVHGSHCLVCRFHQRPSTANVEHELRQICGVVLALEIDSNTDRRSIGIADFAHQHIDGASESHAVGSVP